MLAPSRLRGPEGTSWLRRDPRAAPGAWLRAGPPPQHPSYPTAGGSCPLLGRDALALPVPERRQPLPGREGVPCSGGLPSAPSSHAAGCCFGLAAEPRAARSRRGRSRDMALPGESAVRRALASSRRGVRGTVSPTAPGQGP